MKDDKFYGDVLCDVWRAGKNPDLVDPDRVDWREANGFSQAQVASWEIQRQARPRTEDGDD